MVIGVKCQPKPDISLKLNRFGFDRHGGGVLGWRDETQILVDYFSDQVRDWVDYLSEHFPPDHSATNGGTDYKPQVAAICAWMELIKETDRTIIAEVMG